MFQGGDVDFLKLVDIVVVELSSWRRIATQYITIHTKQSDQNLIEDPRIIFVLIFSVDRFLRWG